MNQLVENQFRTESVAISTNTGAGQVEQRQIAEAQAMLLMAERFPRNQVDAMDRILNAFTRPSLAEVAEYQYAKGGSDISGASIRAAEAIAQQWGNIEFGFKELSRGVDHTGAGFSLIEAYALDYQARTRKPLQFIVRHWRDTKSGGYALKEERDIYELTANMAQRRVRACILSIIPGDVTEMAMKQAQLTLKTTADVSPEAMQKMVDAFGGFGVTKEHIEKRIQRRIEAIQPAQVVSLKRVYVSLRDEMSVASDWFEIGEGASTAKKPEGPTPYPDEKFAKELPKWRELISKGKKTAEEIIALAGSKHVLSDAQKAAITEGWADMSGGPQTSATATDGPVINYAYVADQMNKAKTTDDLDAAADLVGGIVDMAQRKELSALFQQRKAALAG